MKRIRLAGTAIVAVLGLVVAGCDGDGAAEDDDWAKQTETVLLFQFEKFQTAPRIDGGEVVLSSLAGKVVLLDLFGTWCPPCRRSAPVLVSLYERYRDKGFEIIGLAYEQTPDVEQAKRAVEAFRREFRIPYVLAVGPDVLWEELRENAHVKGNVPTFVLLDRQGVVRGVFEGLPPGREAVLADRTERLLAEPYVSLGGP
ncbi:MAG TPA: TlpA disulfide reductase family protein [Phycisphaerae bacterium]|nr:TlpA disulfide reductase family protein [Phycisphaerae bacterium]